MIGTLLLILVLVPLIPMPPDMAPGLLALAAVNLMVLLLLGAGWKASDNRRLGVRRLTVV